MSLGNVKYLDEDGNCGSVLNGVRGLNLELSGCEELWQCEKFSQMVENGHFIEDQNSD